MVSLICLLSIPAHQSIYPIHVDGELCHPRNLMVQYDVNYGLSPLRKAGYKILHDIPEISYAVVEAPVDRLQQTRTAIRSLKGIKSVSLDRAAKPAYTPNDPIWPDMWHMRAIKADLAWDITKGDPSVVVALIDTGLNVTHPDIAPNIFHNPGEIPNNGIDDDGNGYIDDDYGWDFAYNDNVTDDVVGHGTACSGLIAAVQDNNLGVTGVAPHTRVMALKASNDSGYFYDSANVPAYIYAANNGAKVLSMSFFSDRVSPPERAGIDYCWNNGVVPVAASGNDSTVYPYYPAAYENTLSVAAVDGNLNKAGFSDFGSWVDVSAPGVGLSTITASGGYTGGFAGTSGACPHVAGLAALCFAANPGATNVAVRDAIEDSATLQNQAPFGEFSNYGLINCQLAVQRMQGASVPDKAPTIRWINTFNGANQSRNMGKRAMRAYGRGLGAPNVVAVHAGNQSYAVIKQTRDYIDFAGTPAGQTVTIDVNGTTVATVTPYSNGTFLYPLTEGSSQGANVTGNFLSTLMPSDNQVMRCPRTGDGYVIFQGTFRLVNVSEITRLVLRRRYTGTSVGTENVELYDWSSASYPYGSFVSLGSGPVPTSMTTTTFPISNPGRFLDDDKTVYLRITTSNNLPSGAALELDLASLGS